MDPRLQVYLKNVLRTAHSDTTLPSVLEEKMIMDLYLQLEQRLTDFIFDHLPEHEHERYYELADQDTHLDTIIIFLEERIPNIQDRLSELLNAFSNDYATWVSARA